MRLTLRTLMAYRDGVLSTAETSDLHRRIKQSEVAGNLLRRIESVVQRTQIHAPKVDGTGLGGDANTVAEYLDDALPGEQVPEFERICIVESDVQLAELAHCHQLLADAMHSQVRVPQQLKSLIVGLSDPSNRQQLEQRLVRESKTVEAVIVAEPNRRGGSNQEQQASVHKSSHDMQHRIDGAHSHSSAAETASERPQVQAPMVTSGGGSIKPQGLDLEGAQLAHEIPEYLVGSGTDGWRIPLAICTMIGLLAFLGWQALGPIDGVRQLFKANNSIASRDTSADSGANAGNEVKAAVPKDANAIAKNAEPKPAPPKPDVAGDSQADAATNPAANAAPAVPAAEVNAAENSPSTGVDTKMPNDTPQSIPPVANEVARPTESESPPSPRSKSVVWTASGAGEERAVLYARRLTPDGQFSLVRVAPKVPIADSAEIVVPPATRATLDLAGGCQWTVCGPTQMRSSLPMEDETLVLSPLCKALVKAGTHGNLVRVATPAGSVAIQFLDGSSMAGIEVAYRPVASGLVSDRRAYKPMLIIVAVEGELAILYQEESQSKELKLMIGEGLALIDSVPRGFKLGEIPEWYRGTNGRPLDEQATSDLNRQLPPGVEVGDTLLQLCSNRRPETAALAIQSSILLGDWSAFVSGFLANDAMRTHWSSTIALAEQMIAADPGNADALRASLESVDPARGQEIYKLLNGIPEDEQPSVFLPRLIELLDSPELDMRVLAFTHLRRLTGKDLGYQPQSANRSAVQQWRRELSSNRLKLNTIGDPLWEAKK